MGYLLPTTVTVDRQAEVTSSGLLVVLAAEHGPGDTLGSNVSLGLEALLGGVPLALDRDGTSVLVHLLTDGERCRLELLHDTSYFLNWLIYC